MFSIGNAIKRTTKFIDDFSLVILLATSPFFLFPSPTRSSVLLLIPILSLTARLAGRQFMPRTPVDGALFLLLVMAVVSIWATPDILFSLSKVVGLIFGIVVFFQAVRRLGGAHRLWLECHLFGFAGAALALLALVGTNWLAKFPILRGITSHLPKLVRGVPGAEEGFQPNAVAGALVLFIPLQLALVLRKPPIPRTQPSDTLSPVSGENSPNTFAHCDPERPPLPSFGHPLPLRGGEGTGEGAVRRKGWGESDGFMEKCLSYRNICELLRKIQFLPLILTSGTLVITQSRGAWVGMTLGLIVFLFCIKPQWWRWILLIVLVGIVGILSIFGGKFKSMTNPEQGSGVELSVAGRLEVWSRGIYAIQDFPFTGMGMNMFRRVMPILYPSFLTSPDFDVAHAHNHLIQVALDLGVPGLIAYLALWLGVGFLLAFSYLRSRHLWLRNVAAGLGAGLIAHFVFGMADAIPLGAKVGILFWLALALAVATFQIVFQEVHDESKPSEVG